MGIFNRRSKKKEEQKDERSLIAKYYGESFNLIVYRYAKSIYNIPEVRTAIETMTNIFASIPIYHKKVKRDGTVDYLDDEFDFVLGTRPNNLQNASQFWKSVIKQLLLESNVFIEPIFDQRGRLKAIYPLPNRYFDFEIHENKAQVRFYDEPKGTLLEKHNLEDLVYVSRFCSLTGGEETNLGLYETVIQALANQIIKITDPNKVKAIVQGRAGQTANLKPDDVKGEMKAIEKNFSNDYVTNNMAYLDAKLAVTPVNWQENDVNRELMAFVINVVYNYFGINENIINNSATEIERETFIAQTIKPIAEQFEQELSYKLFTEQEYKAGHRIEFDTFALSINTLTSKVSLFSIATRNGFLNIDEIREQLGYPKLPNGLGQMYRVTGDTMNLENVDKFQSAQKGVDENTVVPSEQGDNITSQQKEVDSG